MKAPESTSDRDEAHGGTTETRPDGVREPPPELTAEPPTEGTRRGGWILILLGVVLFLLALLVILFFV